MPFLANAVLADVCNNSVRFCFIFFLVFVNNLSQPNCNFFNAFVFFKPSMKR